MKKIIFTSVLISLSILLFGQDIIIDFNGAGASTDVDVVEIVNLSNCTSIEVPGNSSLNLTTGTIVGVSKPINVDEFLVMPYPNPFMGNTTIKFYLPKKNNIEMSVNNINGQTIAKTSQELYAGIHSYKFTTSKAGMLFITISGDDFKQSAKVMSHGNSLLSTELSYQGNEPVYNITKSGNNTYSKDFSFTVGDMLKLKGVSGNFATVQTDSPIASKTYIFDFSGCTDYDGNNYAIVEIGDQIWTAENIKTTHYSNGDAIPFVEDDTEWANLGDNDLEKAYCFYNNDTASIYGALYTYAAATNGDISGTDVQGVCPDGWHVPNNDEWVELITFLDGSLMAGGKLKSKCNSLWNAPNEGATNETGFSAFPGGLRDYDWGDSYGAGDWGYWWTATQDNQYPTHAWMHYMDSSYPEIFPYSQYKSQGFSVRCVKNID